MPYDVKGSIAHAQGLVEAGHLTAEECGSLTAALEQLALTHESGEWSISREEEDCHTALETRLTERLGDLGKKIHLGRSRNDQVLADESLVLVDAGCEFEFYTADVTRTYPVNGTFTDAQREVYEVVLAANVAAIDACVAGTPFQRLQEVAVETLTQGLVDLGLLEGEVTELIEEKAYRRFYMHNIGHWLGMDVHDAGAYSSEGNSRKLEPGMVLTIEPGLYLLPNDEEIPERYRGIGVRIEDDVLVTEGEPEVLTASIPKAVAELEEVLR